MKTNYRPRSSFPASRKRLAYVGLTLFLCIAASLVLRTFVFDLASPAWKGANALTGAFGVWTRVFQSKVSLIKENEDLKQELASYSDAITSLRAVSDSRDALLAAYGRSASSTGIAASVLVHPPETPYDSLVIDAGADDGVRPGAEVFSTGGALLGSVGEVEAGQSQVTLYSSSGLRTDAVLERGQVPVTLVGQGGGNFEVDLPKDVNVSVGDRVLSPHLAGSLLGAVGDVETSPTDSAKHVRIASPINVSSLRYVLVR